MLKNLIKKKQPLLLHCFRKGLIPQDFCVNRTRHAGIGDTEVATLGNDEEKHRD